MSKPILSILIPTIFGREEETQNILNIITDQITEKEGKGWVGKDDIFFGFDIGDIEIICCKDNKEISIGEKRELLYGKANGLYSWQIDDDDSIAPNAIELILKAIKENPDVDCVTFEERCQMNGQLYCANHSLRYDDWEGDGSRLLSDGFHFHRTPFYKNVVKTNIAQSVPFEYIRFGEDHAWSRALKPHLKTEAHIPKQLYYYIHEHNQTFEERYGLN